MKERSWLYAPRRMKTFWWVLAWLGIFVALMFVAGVAGGIILHGQDSGKAGERVGALFGWVLGFAAYGLAYWLSEIEVLPPPGPVGHTLALTLSCICGLGSALNCAKGTAIPAPAKPVEARDTDAPFLAACESKSSHLRCQCVLEAYVTAHREPEMKNVAQTWARERRLSSGASDSLNVALIGCPEPVKSGVAASPGGDGLDWTVSSADGSAVLRQTPEPGKKCQFVCTIGETTVWSAAGPCFGKAGDFRFVSADCERSVVVFAIKPGATWQTRTVATVHNRATKGWDVGLVTVMKSDKNLSTSPSWLRGVAGAPGEPPRYNAEGTSVSFEAVDGTHSEISLLAK